MGVGGECGWGVGVFATSIVEAIRTADIIWK